ncbi:MAG: S8 family serine peptidase [Clostridia bacterium]|nr:S8 family serine peptidase [Clostridia bacterium]
MKKRNLIISALISGMMLQLFPLSAAVPEATASHAEYNGEGMCIAILDNGFFLTHESFVLTNDSPKLTKEKSDTLLASTFVGASESAPESLYINAKIPFAYDYGDGDVNLSQERYDYHGTAMVSIAAGNGSTLSSPNPAATGIAPEAQILAMKVYSDTREAVTEDAMVSAIEDAIILGADVILIALAEPCGVEFDLSSEKLTAAVTKADEMGVIVVCPAGDVLEYGNESIYELEYETSDPPATIPDIGTIAWPGTLDSVLTVGSAEGNTVESEYFTLLGGKQIPFGDSNYLYTTVTGGKTFASHFDGQTLEYVIVDGYGTPEDFAAAGELAGKLAVVRRGTVSFNDKAKNAAACGAIGVIVTDTQPDNYSALSVKAELSEAPIPLIIVSSDSGQQLKLAEDKRLTLTGGVTCVTKTRETPSPSSYSASGTTPELGLKPDITVVGSNVQCASIDGSYAYMSSTTASAAKAAGMCAIVKEKLTHEASPLGTYEMSRRIKALLVGSAELMTQQIKAIPYSPRVQGGGAVSLEAALTSELLLTQNGSCKIELGDGHTRLVQFKVTAENLSDSDKACTLDAIVGSDSYSAYTYAELDIENSDDPLYARLGVDPADTLAFTNDFTVFPQTQVMLGSLNYQLNSAARDYSPYSFTLAAGESQTFDVIVCLDEATYLEYKKHFTNGFFIEGFVRLTSTDETVSIPFLGYSGNFGAAPYLDADLYSGVQAMYDGIYLYRYINDSEVTDSGTLILGADTHSEPYKDTKYDKTALAFSPIIDRNNAAVVLNFGLLRTVSDITVTVTDISGNLIEQVSYGTIPRTYVSTATGMPATASITLWNGRAADNASYIYPDGMYTVTVSYAKPISLTRSSFSYDIFLDTTAPSIVSTEFITVDDKPALIVAAEDNHKVMRITVVDSDSTEASAIDVGLYDISDLFGEYIYIDIFDYAANSTVMRIKNPHYIPDDD